MKARFTALAAAAAVALTLPVAAHAGFYTWANASGGMWNTPSNWGSSSYPHSFFDFADFGLNAAYTVDASNPSQVSSIGAVSVRAGSLTLMTSSSFGAQIVVGDFGAPALLVLSGYTGAPAMHTVGSDGTLVLMPGSSLVSSVGSTVGLTVRENGRLMGDQGGFSGKTFRCFGILDPGTSSGATGVLSLGAARATGLDMRDTAVLHVDIAGPAAGSGYDQVNVVDGSLGVLLAGTLEISLDDAYTPTDGEQYDVLVSPGGYTGAFANVVVPDRPGVEFEVSYGADRVTVTASVVATAITVAFDIQPGPCGSPFNMKKQGVVPAAILGGPDFDVTGIDMASLALEGVPPIRGSVEDVAGPGAAEDACACSSGPDGWSDLSLKFDAPALAEAMGAVSDGETRTLTLTGVMLDGTEITGMDCVVILDKGKGNGKKDADEAFGPAGLALRSSNRPDQRAQTIAFDLPEAGTIRLGVFDVRGRLVTSWGPETYSAGTHTVQWNVAGVSSGVYFYRLQTETGEARAKQVITLR